MSSWDIRWCEQLCLAVFAEVSVKRIHQVRTFILMGTLCAALFTTSRTAAQAVYGAITGRVQDPTGAAVPGATVTVIDVEKGSVATYTSNASGEFSAEQLIPDHYNVKVTATGFKSFEQTGLQVFADTAPTVNATLVVGSTGETVQVSADTVPQLKTDKTDVAQIFSAQEIEELPIPDHNFTNLQLLLPGATQLGWSHAASEDPQGSKQIQIDGQAFGGVNYTLDGTDNQDAILGIIVINPNSDSMSETKIATQNYDAEFGKAVASVETVQTKSGSNSFHGTAFDNRESNANLAREPFSQPAGNAFPGGLKSQFGGSLGGFLWKSKAFFFTDYQGVRQKVGTSAKMTVPTQNLINSCLGTVTPEVNGVPTPGCDFSEYIAAGPGHVLYNNTGGTVNGVANGSPWPGNVIPASLISPTSMNLFKLLQPYAPNINQASLTDNYAQNGKGIFNSDQWDVRLDYQVNDKAHVFGRFSRFTDVLSGGTLFGAAGGAGFGIGGYGGTSRGANDSFAGGVDYAVNSHLLAELRLGYFRYDILTSKYDQTASNLPVQGENVNGTGANSGLTVAQQFGAPDFNVADIAISGNAGPNNSQADGAQYGAGLNVDRCNCPLTEREDQFQIVNNWTKVLGTHEIKFGVDIRYARNLRVPSDNDRSGINNFGSGPTSNGSAGTGLGFASYVLGDVTAFNRFVSTSTNAKEFQPRDFFFVQDTWRVTPKLTANLGLRYEFYAPERVNGAGNGALFNLATGYLSVAGDGGVPLNMGVSAPKFPLNPRLGVAYSYDQKTVIRAGYGRSFDLGVFGSTFGHVVTQNLPVLANQSINAPGSYATYAFQLDAPASAQGGQATGLSNYTPVSPDANGHISIQQNVPGTTQTVGQFVSVRARPFTERLPTLDAWNVSLQRSLTPTLSVTVAYVGNKGTHTLSDGDSNTTNPNEAAISLPANYSSIINGGQGIALHYDGIAADTAAITTYCGTPGNCVNGVPISGTFQGATTSTNLLRRYNGGTLPACSGACGVTQDISYYGDDQDTHYNALQISVAKTMTHGLSINGNYAYQRARSTGNSFATWNKPAVIGNDSFVRRNAFTAWGLYKLPFGRKGDFLKNAGTVVDEIVGGWEFSPTFVWQSGLPFTLGYSNCGSELPSDAPCYVNGDPGKLGTGQTGLPGANTNFPRFFKQQALGGSFTDPGLDTIGNSGRNSVFGPHLFNSDMSLMKNFNVLERAELQFRMDAFNAFNHVNWGTPNGTIDSTNAGQITSGPFPNGSVNPRQLQFTARVQF